MKSKWSDKLVIEIIVMCFTQCLSFSQVEISQQDCYSERKNMDTISNAQAEIQLIAQNYCIVLKKKNKRYIACNLPDSLKQEAIKVTFSGIVKEIYPNERRVGSPFVISEIRKVE